MARKCFFCNKGPKAGKNVSHSHRVTNRWFKPNLIKIKAKVDNRIKRVYICTSCFSKHKQEGKLI